MSDTMFPLSVLNDFSRESYAKGYTAGVQAAREAVADVRASLTFLGAVVVLESINKADALAAIDALRGDA